MKTLIIPTDFSPVSLGAVNYGADLAIAIDAEILLVNIVPIPISTFEVPISQSTFTEMEDDVDQQLAKLKEHLLLRTENKITINTYSTIGTVEYDLEEISGKKNPFAVIMSPKSSGAFERFFMGSNTLSAVHNIHYPVLIIPENGVYKKIERIALAADLKAKISNNTIKIIKNWVNLLDVPLDIINVTAANEIGTNVMSESVTIENYFAELHPKFHFIKQEKTEDGINQFIKTNHPDLLIVIPKNRNLIETILHKSSSKKFILHPNIPVLAIAEND